MQKFVIYSISTLFLTPYCIQMSHHILEYHQDSTSSKSFQLQCKQKDRFSKHNHCMLTKHEKAFINKKIKLIFYLTLYEKKSKI